MSAPTAADILDVYSGNNHKGLYPVVQNELSTYIADVNADANASLVVSNYHLRYETALETQLDEYLGFGKELGLKPADAAHSDVFTLISSAIGLQPEDVADALLMEAQAISTEVDRAASVETVISSDLSTEVNRAASVENVIISDLSTEVHRAPSVETVISTSLSTEENRAASVEAILSSGISSEIKDRSTEIANLKGASLDKVYDVVSQYVTASAVEAYRTRLWLSEMDRFLTVIRQNVSVAGVPTYNDAGVVFSAAVINDRLDSDPQTVLGKVATDFGLVQTILSTNVLNSYQVETGAGSGVGVLGTLTDNEGKYQQLFSQSG